MGNLMKIPDITPEAIESLNFGNNFAPKKYSSFDEKNYLNVRLADNEDSKEIRIRLLPMYPNTTNPFIQTFFHSVSVPTEVAESGYKSFLCLSHNADIDHEKFGNKCPFCELNKKAYEASLKETDELKIKNYHKLSLDNLVKSSVIVRCIERGKEDEGVKFWKFNLSRRKDDPYHSMMDLYNSAKKEGEMRGETINIFSMYNGVDLILNIKKNTDNNRDVRTVINITTSRYESRIGTDEQISKWVNDEKKWYDVFTPKPYEYLKLISESRVPWYDKTQNKWVDKNEFISNTNEAGKAADFEIKKAENMIFNNSYESTAQSNLRFEQDSQRDNFLNEFDADRGLPF